MSLLKVSQIKDLAGTGPAYASGHTIQTVSFTTTSPAETTSTSFQNTSLTLTITPKSASSKILISFSAGFLRHINLAGGSVLAIFRGNNTGTNIAPYAAYRWQNQSVMSDASVAGAIFDSPNTTSPLTYTICIRSENSSNTARIDGAQTITLQEVAA